MSTGQENKTAAATGGQGWLRTSHADREEAVDLLKSAFVDGRLTRDELDARVGEVLGSKTYAQLDALTIDISAPAIEAAPPIQATLPIQATPATRPPKTKAARSGTGVLIAACVAAVTALAAAGAHARPNPDVMACQAFSAWAYSGYGAPNTPMLLDFSVTSAHQGSNHALTGDLDALEQALVRYDNTTSASSQQAAQNSVYAAMDRINTACTPYNS